MQEPQGAGGWHVAGLGTRRWGEDGQCELAMTIAKCLQCPSSRRRPHPPNPPTSPPTQPTAFLTWPPRTALAQPYIRASARLAAWGGGTSRTRCTILKREQV